MFFLFFFFTISCMYDAFQDIEDSCVEFVVIEKFLVDRAYSVQGIGPIKLCTNSLMGMVLGVPWLTNMFDDPRWVRCRCPMVQTCFVEWWHVNGVGNKCASSRWEASLSSWWLVVEMHYLVKVRTTVWSSRALLFWSRWDALFGQIKIHYLGWVEIDYFYKVEIYYWSNQDTLSGQVKICYLVKSRCIIGWVEMSQSWCFSRGWATMESFLYCWYASVEVRYASY